LLEELGEFEEAGRGEGGAGEGAFEEVWEEREAEGMKSMSRFEKRRTMRWRKEGSSEEKEKMIRKR
jgi:hypothetical protein